MREIKLIHTGPNYYHKAKNGLLIDIEPDTYDLLEALTERLKELEVEKLKLIKILVLEGWTAAELSIKLKKLNQAPQEEDKL